MLIYLYGQFILETSSWFCRIVAGISCPFLSDVLIFSSRSFALFVEFVVWFRDHANR